MPRTNKTNPLIEFKGTTLPLVTVTLRSLQLGELAEAANTLFGDDPFFDGDAAVFELSQAGDAPSAKWPFLKELFRTHGLNVIGVRGGSEALRLSAAAAGLPTYAAVDRTPRVAAASEDASPPAPADKPPVAAVSPAVPPRPEPKPEPEPAAAGAGGNSPTLFVTRPLRSGQQIYARGGDLVVLAAVNSGAEVIADGSIHIYAPLHGRALAGASGATAARIFCTHFDAQLVSVAGIYRTFESGVPVEVAGKPVQVRLTEKPGETTGNLLVEALKTD